MDAVFILESSKSQAAAIVPLSLNPKTQPPMTRFFLVLFVPFGRRVAECGLRRGERVLLCHVYGLGIGIGFRV